MSNTNHDHTTAHIELKQKLLQKKTQLSKVLDELDKIMPLSAIHIRSILETIKDLEMRIAIYDNAAIAEKELRSHMAKINSRPTSFSINEAKDSTVEDIITIHNSKQTQ